MNQKTNNVETNNDKNSYEWVLFKESGELWEIRYGKNVATNRDNFITVEDLEINNNDYKIENGELIDYLDNQGYETTEITIPNANTVIYHFIKTEGVN